MSHSIPAPFILASLLFGSAIASAQDLSPDNPPPSVSSTTDPNQSVSNDLLSSPQPQVSFDIFHSDTPSEADDETVTPASNPEADSDASETDTALDASSQDDTQETEVILEHDRKFAIFEEDRAINVKLITSAGDITCSLYAGTHPATVLNFLALAEGTPTWTDAGGKMHSTPYYYQLKFGKREKGKYVTSGLRPEGTSFVIADERCSIHQMKAGSIAMVQPYPGQASTQFMLLARDLPLLNGMYSVFGQCTPVDTIKQLTSADATLDHIERIP